MNKVKVRCSICGKSFKTPSAKKTVCPSCDANLKRARHLQSPAVTTPVTVPTSPVDVRAALRAAEENRGQFDAYKVREPAPQEHAAAVAERAPAPQRQAAERGAQEAVHGARGTRLVARPTGKPRPQRPTPAPRPARERKEVERPKPFVPSSEQVSAIRERYLALAQPEFDGIRHRIANELGIPLRAVKEVVKEIRVEAAIPSWWERSSAALEPAQLDQIRALYVPQLPSPALGVHKAIAESLKLSHTSVYQAIGTIRAELELPRYTPREEPEAGPESVMAAGGE